MNALNFLNNNFELDDVQKLIEDFFIYVKAGKFEFLGITETPPTNSSGLKTWKADQTLAINTKLHQTEEYIEYLQTGLPSNAKKWSAAWQANMTRGYMPAYHYMLTSMIGISFHKPKEEYELLKEIAESPYLSRYIDSVDLDNIEVTWKRANSDFSNALKASEPEKTEGKSKTFGFFRIGFKKTI